MSDGTTERLRTVFAGLVRQPGELEALLQGATIENALTLDSIGYLEMVMAVEREFGLQFDFEQLDAAFQTLATLAAFLRSARHGTPNRADP